jgi:hypothetical protein
MVVPSSVFCCISLASWVVEKGREHFPKRRQRENHKSNNHFPTNAIQFIFPTLLVDKLAFKYACAALLRRIFFDEFAQSWLK